MAKKLMKGNEVVGASAIKAGCHYFFGYPITPQNEIPEYMSKHLPKLGGAYVQAESEVAAINMLFGAAATGRRAMTSSSSPGIALKQEGISYIAGAEVPCVLVNMSRGGPGLGGILPSQADYYQMTRGGGNGDYRNIVYAPNNLQELSDLVQKSFYIADKYRMMVSVLSDGMIGQMMEPVEIKDMNFEKIDHSSWSLEPKKTGKKHSVTSLFLKAEDLNAHNVKLNNKYEIVKKEETMYETHNLKDAEIVLVSYGSPSRVIKNAIDDLAKEGHKIGLIRPITLWPFPNKAFDEIDTTTKKVISCELSMGQLVDDVMIASKGRWDVTHYGVTGGILFDVKLIKEMVLKNLGGEK